MGKLTISMAIFNSYFDISRSVACSLSQSRNSPGKQRAALKIMEILEFSEKKQGVGKLSYFTHLNSSAINLGMIPYIINHDSQASGGRRVRSWSFIYPDRVSPQEIHLYFEGISPYIGLKNRPKIYGIGTSNFSRFLLHGHWSLEFSTCESVLKSIHWKVTKNSRVGEKTQKMCCRMVPPFER